jgi:hypothetical protein
MINRREFVGGAVLAVSLGQAVPAQARSSDIEWVIGDERHPEARLFAAGVGRQGARPLSIIDGDVTALWLDHLSKSWSQRPAAVAGLTRPEALFVLEQLAFSHGLRVVMHAEHLVAEGMPTRHQVLRCPGGAARLDMDRLRHQGAAWPAVTAAAVAGWTGAGALRPGPSCSGLAPVPPSGAVCLASWIIAPV